MKTYYAPDLETTPIFEEWVAGTAGQFGLGAIVAVVVVVALLLSLRWRGAPAGEPDERERRAARPGSRGSPSDQRAQES